MSKHTCASAAIAAYESMNKPRSTAQIGIDLGIPEDYNKESYIEGTLERMLSEELNVATVKDIKRGAP